MLHALIGAEASGRQSDSTWPFPRMNLCKALLWLWHPEGCRRSLCFPYSQREGLGLAPLSRCEKDSKRTQKERQTQKSHRHVLTRSHIASKLEQLVVGLFMGALGLSHSTLKGPESITCESQFASTSHEIS